MSNQLRTAVEVAIDKEKTESQDSKPEDVPPKSKPGTANGWKAAWICGGLRLIPFFIVCMGFVYLNSKPDKLRLDAANNRKRDLETVLSLAKNVEWVMTNPSPAIVIGFEMRATNGSSWNLTNHSSWGITNSPDSRGNVPIPFFLEEPRKRGLRRSDLMARQESN